MGAGRADKRCVHLWILLWCLMSSMGCSGVSTDPAWTVRMSGGGRLSVEGNDLYVDFSRRQAWTIRNIKYMGQEIVGEHGANGTVVNATPREGMDPNDPWIGTGHGKEVISSFTVLVDGKAHEFRKGRTLFGNTITIRKESILGPLGHTAHIAFPASGDSLIEKHSYTVLEDLRERFQFLYAFMHCNDNALDQWLAQLGNGEKLEGRAGRKDNKFSLDKVIKRITFYSEALGVGVAYVFPEVYDASKSFIWDRGSDNKLYSRPEIKAEDVKVGDRFEFQLKVIPFSADRTDWREAGWRLTWDDQTP